MTDEMTEQTNSEEAKEGTATPVEPTAETGPDPVEEVRQKALAAAAEQERKLRQRELELHKLQAAVKERDELFNLLVKDPVAFFERTGLPADEVVKRVSSRERPGPVDQIADKVAKLEAELAAQRQREEAAYYAGLEEQAKTDIQSFVNRAADKYELTASAPDAPDMVLEVLEAHYEQTGQIDIEYAVGQVEAYLESVAAKLTRAKKITKFLPHQGTGPSGQAAEASKTLSNAASAAVPSRINTDSDRTLSREESIARAASLLRFGSPE